MERAWTILALVAGGGLALAQVAGGAGRDAAPASSGVAAAELPTPAANEDRRDAPPPAAPRPEPDAEADERLERQVAQLYAALRHDDVPDNALAAIDALSRLATRDARTREVLRRRGLPLLDSPDYQQRCLVEIPLMRTYQWSLLEGDGAELPAPLEETARHWYDQGLDMRHFGWVRCLDEVALDLMLADLDRFEPFLLEQLDHWSIYTRRRAAFVFAIARRTEHLDRIMPSLLESLRDNCVRGDAWSACYAIRRLGRPALAYLPLASDDPQMDFLLEGLSMEIRAPGSSDGMRGWREIPEFDGQDGLELLRMDRPWGFGQWLAERPEW